MFFSVTRRKRRLCAVMATVLALQPIFAIQVPAAAQTDGGAPTLAAGKTEYRIPLRNLRVTPPDGSEDGGTDVGAGDGVVDPGANPEAPVLQFAPPTLQFDISGGYRDARQTILTNTSKGPATLAGIQSSTFFTVSDNCPKTLPAGDFCIVTAKPTEAAVVGDQFKMAVTAPGIEKPGSLTLEVVEKENSPRLSLSETLVRLGEELRPGETVTGAAKLTNLGPGVAGLNTLIASQPGYTVSSDCPATLPVGASCNIGASFSSYKPQTHTQPLVLSATATGDTLLTFYAKVAKAPELLPALEFDAEVLQFEPLEIGATATKNTVLTNKGTAPAELAPLGTDPNFAVTSDCPKSLAIDASCTVSATFKPTKPGTTPRFLLVAAAQSEVTTSILLVGQGQAGPGDPIAKLAFDPTSLPFGNVALEQSSTLQATLTNSGEATAKIKDIFVKEGPKEFTQANDCGAALEPGASCTVTVTFAPLNIEKRSGLVLVTLADETSLGLSAGGIGQAAKLNSGADTIDLGAVQLPGTTMVKRVGLTNVGNVPLTGLGVVSTDTRMIVDFGDCTDVLLPKKGCTLNVSYRPDSGGTFTSGFQLVSANGGTADKVVTGVAVSLTAAPDSLTFPETPQRTSSADQTVTLTNQGTVAVPLGIDVVKGINQYRQTNTCGSSLAAGASCAIAVRYTPNEAGTHSGRIAVSVKSATSSTVALNISLTGKAQDAFLVTTSSVNFQGIALPGTSKIKPVTVTNQGIGPLVGLAVLNSDGRLSINPNDCQDTLQAGKSCTLLVSYAPDVDGLFKSSFVVTSSNAGERSVSIDGTAVSISTSTSQLSFPDTQKGTTSADQSFTLTNTGQAPFSADSIDVVLGSYDYGQSNNCGGMIAPGGTCTVMVRFRPYDLGARSGTWAVVVAGSPVAQVALSGKGVNNFLTVPKTFSVGSVPVGATGIARTFDIKNDTASTVAVTGISVDEGPQFTQSNTCGQPMAPGASCKVSVQFKPTDLGLVQGSIAITSSQGTYMVALSGTGIEPPPPITKRYSIIFLNTEVGSSSAVRTIQYRNDGNGPLTVLGISQLDGLADFNQTNDCGEVLAPGQACNISAVFTPSKLGALKGTVAIYADTGTAYLDLTGKGIGASGVWLSSLGSYGVQLSKGDFGITASGTVKKKTFYLQNSGSVTATQLATSLEGTAVTLDSTTCGTVGAPVQLSAGASCAVTVSWAPPAAGSLTDAVLTVKGGLINGPVVLPLVGEAPAPGLAFLDTPGGAFEVLSSGIASAARTFTVRNTGKFADTISGVEIAGAGFTKTGGTCKVPLNVAIGGTCTVIVTAQGDAPGELAGTIIVKTSRGGAAQQDMSATVVQPAYAVSGAAGANTEAPTNFGDVPVAFETGVGDKIGYFYLRDDSNAATVVLKNSTLTGSSDFTVTAVNVVDYGNISRGVCTEGTTGTTKPCTALPGKAIRIAVKFKPTGPGVKSALLHLEHNGEGGAYDVVLTGSGSQTSTGLWTAGSTTATRPMTTDVVDLGVVRSGYTPVRYLYLTNVGTVGALSAGFTVTGDVQYFNVSSSIARDGFVASDTSYPYACLTRGGETSTKEYLAPCTAAEYSRKGDRNLVLTFTFRRSLAGPGNYSITLTPFSNNGSVVPGPITITAAVQ